jgi:predicted transcriptional regulator
MIGVEALVEIQYLDRQGLNKTQIARRLGIDRKTVRKYVNQDAKTFGQKSGKHQSILDPYKPYLQYRLSKFWLSPTETVTGIIRIFQKPYRAPRPRRPQGPLKKRQRHLEFPAAPTAGALLL